MRPQRSLRRDSDGCTRGTQLEYAHPRPHCAPPFGYASECSAATGGGMLTPPGGRGPGHSPMLISRHPPPGPPPVVRARPARGLPGLGRAFHGSGAGAGLAALAETRSEQPGPARPAASLWRAGSLFRLAVARRVQAAGTAPGPRSTADPLEVEQYSVRECCKRRGDCRMQNRLAKPAKLDSESPPPLDSEHLRPCRSLP